MMALICGSIISGVWVVGLSVIRRFDSPDWVLYPAEIILYVGCGGIIAAMLMHIYPTNVVCNLGLAFLAGSLLLACITDSKSYEVYQFTWWIAAGAESLLMLGSKGQNGKICFGGLVELILFIIIQETGFSKLYGRADCHAFVVCSIAGYGVGMRLWDYLIHMLCAVCGLAIVQLVRRNVTRNGNLKQPVAFVPYITISFWINLYCFSLGKMLY